MIDSNGILKLQNSPVLELLAPARYKRDANGSGANGSGGLNGSGCDRDRR